MAQTKMFHFCFLKSRDTICSLVRGKERKRMAGNVGKEKTIFNNKNCCFPLALLKLFMVSSSLGQQPGEGCRGCLAHMAQTPAAWGAV